MWSKTVPTVLIGFQLLFLLIFVHSCVTYSGVSNQTTKHEAFLDKLPAVIELTDIPPGVFQIVGGIQSFPGEFPYMAALGWRDESRKLDFHCGGVLISSYMVLTAAHCVYLDGKIPDVVHIGGYPLSFGLNAEYPVVNATIFPQYNASQAYYDIALLELGKHAVNTPVCLWTKPHLHGNNVTAIGYGLTEFAGMGSHELLKVDLTVFPEKFCQRFFKRQRKFKTGLSHAHICAGDTHGQKDTCQGDSGGPIIVTHNYKPYAIGITSTGQACSGFPPAIYTKISSYIGWIIKVLAEKGYTLKRECT